MVATAWNLQASEEPDRGRSGRDIRMAGCGECIGDRMGEFLYSDVSRTGTLHRNLPVASRHQQP